VLECVEVDEFVGVEGDAVGFAVLFHEDVEGDELAGEEACAVSTEVIFLEIVVDFGAGPFEFEVAEDVFEGDVAYGDAEVGGAFGGGDFDGDGGVLLFVGFDPFGDFEGVCSFDFGADFGAVMTCHVIPQECELLPIKYVFQRGK